MVRGFERMGSAMTGGPDSYRLAVLKASAEGSIKRNEDGVAIEEFDPDRAPPARQFLRQKV